jgi:uncharacterized integral membrane protein
MAESSRAMSDTTAKPAKNNTRAIIAIIVAVGVLTFVFSNVAPATLRFLFMQFTMPAWAWFLVVLVAGFVIGSLFPWLRAKSK